MNYLIGAGGVGSFIAPALCKLVGVYEVTIMDGDKLEQKNLDRQLFDPTQVGVNKARALAELYECSYIEEFFSFGARAYEMWDTLIVAVDNHPARNEALQVCDYHKCSCIIAANEVHSSEAYYYKPEWKDTNLDPRVFYPEILTGKRGDPRAAAIGCTGEAQEENRQLVTANFSAAALAMHLYVVWEIEALNLYSEAREHLPHRLSQTLSRSESWKAQITK